MALDSLRVIVIDLDTVLLKGLEDYVVSVRRVFRGKKHMPALWVWIPDSFSGFYENASLTQAKVVDYFLIGPFTTGTDLLPNQVLLFSRSVRTLLPIRQKKLCQTIVGDSLMVLENWRSSFSGEYRFEMTQSQKEYLRHRRKSKIFEYLQFPGSLEDLNKSLWIQEKCEGVAIVNGTMMVATSRERIDEWEAILTKELEWIPPADSPHADSPEIAYLSDTTRQENLGGSSPRARKSGGLSMLTEENLRKHDNKSAERAREQSKDMNSKIVGTSASGGGSPSNPRGFGAPGGTSPTVVKSSSQQELELAMELSKNEHAEREAAEARALALAMSASIEDEESSRRQISSTTEEHGQGGGKKIEFVD
ncbi:unnamed protein product [Amoebophrya sp. A25]|nr:unnamed protein product [Amoebophrya sp. A25]|eukprot:GSA25T00019830001.1